MALITVFPPENRWPENKTNLARPENIIILVWRFRAGLKLYQIGTMLLEQTGGGGGGRGS